MGEVEKQVLQMLEEGSISAEDAQSLLAAIGQDKEEDANDAQVIINPDPAETGATYCHQCPAPAPRGNLGC